MQRLETRWLIVHSPQRTVIVAHHWNDDFFCTCGAKACRHIREVQAKINKEPLRLAKRVMPKRITVHPLPEQMKMPDFFFTPTRKFR
jgi:hypothetical protein